MSKHCLDCGNELKELNYAPSSTKYICEKCNKYWFKTTRTVVEWTKQRKED